MRKREMRDAAAGRRAFNELLRGHSRERSIKDMAEQVTERAYMIASANNTLPAHARQVYYKARALMQGLTERELRDDYYTQQILPGFMQDNRSLTASWDVVFDARGHLYEPHTQREIPLGTLHVRDYLSCQKEEESDGVPTLLRASYPTSGAANRFCNVLFIEKEGFMPLFNQTQLAERYDLAIMSTKGLSTTAARTLIERLRGVHFYVLRDFDKAGFSIASTLARDTRRYSFASRPLVTDLGIRLADVEAESLESETVVYKELTPEHNLRRNGATPEEIGFLVKPRADVVRGRRWGQRVELNAFASDKLIAWIEGKLKACGVKKVLPDDATLNAAYQRAVYVTRINSLIKDAHDEAQREAAQAKLPASLRKKITAHLKRSPALSWDNALLEVLREEAALMKRGQVA
jgi:hypothetical protein